MVIPSSCELLNFRHICVGSCWLQKHYSALRYAVFQLIYCVLTHAICNQDHFVNHLEETLVKHEGLKNTYRFCKFKGLVLLSFQCCSLGCLHLEQMFPQQCVIRSLRLGLIFFSVAGMPILTWQT